MTTDVEDLLAPGDIAELLDVNRATVWEWNKRAKRARAAGRDDDRLFPEPTKLISDRFPVWDRAVVEEWAKATGRMS